MLAIRDFIGINAVNEFMRQGGEPVSWSAGESGTIYLVTIGYTIFYAGHARLLKLFLIKSEQ